jgi:hypothetical protein
MSKKKFDMSNQLFLGSAADQIMVRVLVAYTLISCGELPF